MEKLNTKKEGKAGFHEKGGFEKWQKQAEMTEDSRDMPGQKRRFLELPKPRLCVFRSNSNISAQVIDDVNRTTLVSASSLDKDLKARYCKRWK